MASTKHQKPKDANARRFPPKAGRNSAGYKGKKKQVGLEPGRKPLFEECAIENHERVAEATERALKLKLATRKDGVMEIISTACALYALGKDIKQIKKDLNDLFPVDKAAKAMCIFKAELGHKAALPLKELLNA